MTTDDDQRPPVWVGHIELDTDRLDASVDFMRAIGLRPLVRHDGLAVLELRGGTHLVLLAKADVVPGKAPFDLMVEDLDATHRRFEQLGLAPSPIERVTPNHRRFVVTEPAGHTIDFHCNHVSGLPV